MVRSSHGFDRDAKTRECIERTFASSMEFEEAMSLILGQKARHTADIAGSPSAAKKLMLQATRKLAERTSEIITMDTRLRERLLADLRDLERRLKDIDKHACRVFILASLFRITGRLLGYDWMNGNVYRTPIYYRTMRQEFRDYENGLRNYDAYQKDEISAVIERRRACVELKDKGLPYNRIARILNTTEYEVTQLVRDQHLAKIVQSLQSGLTFDEISRNLPHDEWGEQLMALLKRIKPLRDQTR